MVICPHLLDYRVSLLTLASHHSLQKLLHANKRLATAYLLKEEFGQLWAFAAKAGPASFLSAGRSNLNGNSSGLLRSLRP